MKNTTPFPEVYFGKKNADKKNNLPTKKELDKQIDRHKKKLVDFILQLPENSNLLDAGCGVGKAIKLVTVYRPDINIYAIDITDMTDFIPETAIFTVAGVEQVDEIFDENFFDAIICQHVIEHLIYPLDMMNAFKKVLKADAMLFIETPNWVRGYIPWSRLYFWNDYTHVRLFSKKTFRRLCADYDFDIKKLQSGSMSGLQSHNISYIWYVAKKNSTGFFDCLFKYIKYSLISFYNSFMYDVLILVAKNNKKSK